MKNLDAELYLNLVRGGAASLERNRQPINDLNVFPIPDGDTGDNMYMTIEAGCHARGGNLSEAAGAVSQAMLLGARGNSGVILSRIFAGLSKGLKGLSRADVNAFSAAMEAAVKEAYSAVSQPVEGTILTVLREGVQAAAGAPGLEEYFDRWIEGMDASLQRTPELLEVLRKAGVVDSGGAGLLCIGEGMRDALHGRFPVKAGNDVASRNNAASGDAAPAGNAAAAIPVDINAFTEDSVLEFGYCTEFLLRLQRAKVDLEHFDEGIIRAFLESQGDSLVFFRDGSIVKVHVHTQDPGAILTRCREWGEFLSIKIENMTLQHHENHMEERFARSRKELGIVVVASGKGLTDTFREMGAHAIIEGGQTMNPPVERFLEAFREVNANTILVFPNNDNILLTARQAAELYQGSDVRIIPTRTLGEGYFSLAGLDAELPAGELVTSLTQAAEAVTTGLVSRAVRDSAGAHKGAYIGFVGKNILTEGTERSAVAKELAERMDTASAGLLVLFYGEGVPAQEAQTLSSTLEQRFPHTEIILREGGQPIYDYLLVTC